MFIIIIILLVLILGHHSILSVFYFTLDITHAGEEFIATNEWQEIKPGQSIPKGLHVRINMATGLKEAKLLDPEDDNSEQSQPVSFCF